MNLLEDKLSRKFEEGLKNSSSEIDSFERKILSGDSLLNKDEIALRKGLLIEDLSKFKDHDVMRNHSLAVF
jgi:hypothetical protein